MTLGAANTSQQSQTTSRRHRVAHQTHPSSIYTFGSSAWSKLGRLSGSVCSLPKALDHTATLIPDTRGTMAMGWAHRSISLLLLLAATATLLAPLASAQPFQVCGTSGNYTSNSIYQSNINLLSAMLPMNASSSPDLFAKASVGAMLDTVYAMALCRGDINAAECESCVNTAFNDAQELCAYNKEATIYYDECYLSFSSENFLNNISNDRIITALSSARVVSSMVPAFDAAVAALLNTTGEYAAANSTRRFATGERDYDRRSYPTIYGLTQCTPDLSPHDCRSCLGSVLGLMPRRLSGRQGGRITGLRCNFRYEVYSFSGATSLGPAPAPSPAPLNLTPAATPALAGEIYPYRL